MKEREKVTGREREGRARRGGEERRKRESEREREREREEGEGGEGGREGGRERSDHLIHLLRMHDWLHCFFLLVERDHPWWCRCT